jgi:hypothetical protein
MSAPETAGYKDCMGGTWLAVSLGVDPRRIDAMRRAGELIAVRRPGSTEWLYPSWQIANGRVRDIVPQIVAAGRDRGLDEGGLYAALTARRGMAGDSSLADLIAADEGGQAVSALRHH